MDGGDVINYAHFLFLRAKIENYSVVVSIFDENRTYCCTTHNVTVTIRSTTTVILRHVQLWIVTS